MQRSADRQKTLAAHGALISDERLQMTVFDARSLTTLEGRVLVHGEEEYSGRSYLMLEGTDARVHYVYCTPEIEAARNRGRLRTNSFIRLQESTADARPALEITTWAIQRRSCATRASCVRSDNVLSAAASSLRMTAGMDGSVAIKRRFGTRVTTLETPSVIKRPERDKNRDRGR